MRALMFISATIVSLLSAMLFSQRIVRPKGNWTTFIISYGERMLLRGVIFVPLYLISGRRWN